MICSMLAGRPQNTLHKRVYALTKASRGHVLYNASHKQADYHPFSRELYICQESEWEHTTITITIITRLLTSKCCDWQGNLVSCSIKAISFYFLGAALLALSPSMFLKTISCLHQLFFPSVTNQPIRIPNFTPLSLLIFLFIHVPMAARFVAASTVPGYETSSSCTYVSIDFC